MKRTKSINLDRMRKSSARFKLKPLVLGIAAFSLAGCSDSRKADIYSSIDECKRDNPSAGRLCETSYQKALEKSVKTAPKYTSLRDCAYEFGRKGCTPFTSRTGQNWYMPEMSGFMLASSLENGEEDYESEPVYSSSSYSSGHYGRWTTADGYSYKKRSGSYTVRGDAFKPKPAVNRTISRGGFGSTVAAKASWGGSNFKSSWGG